VKALLSGAAVAAIAGVMAGAAMQPQLYAGDRPAGPQMFADWAGARSTGPFDPGTTFVSYRGKIPDYVMGTDWKKSMAWPDERAAVSPPESPPEREVATADDAPAPDQSATLTRAAYAEAASPAPAYPSMGGAHPSVTEVAPPTGSSGDDAPAVSG
jgi:hypothetical protein